MNQKGIQRSVSAHLRPAVLSLVVGSKAVINLKPCQSMVIKREIAGQRLKMLRIYQDQLCRRKPIAGIDRFIFRNSHFIHLSHPLKVLYNCDCIAHPALGLRCEVRILPIRGVDPHKKTVSKLKLL